MEEMINITGITSASLLSLVAVFGFTLVALIPLLAAGNALGFFRFGWQTLSDGVHRLPSRKKEWGTVYDSLTLRPIPFVVVTLLGTDRRVLEKRVTDAGGRYGFLTSAASLSEQEVRVSLEASHDGYRFPSHERESASGFIYGEAYRGDSVVVSADTLINFDIPMDPVKAPVRTKRGNAPSIAVGLATAAMADAGLWVGIVTVPLAFVLEPNPFTLGVVFVFTGVVSLRLFGVREHPFGVVTNKQGQAIPFALVALHTDSGRRVSFAVSDERGRYVLSADRGGYVLSAHTPANVSPPRELERSFSVRKGWVTEQIVL